MDALGPWHLLIIAGVFVVLFGAKKLPDAARSLGKSARILKTELKGLHDDDDAASKQAVQQTAVLPTAPPAVVTEAPAQPVATGDQPPAP